MFNVKKGIFPLTGFVCSLGGLGGICKHLTLQNSLARTSPAVLRRGVFSVKSSGNSRSVSSAVNQRYLFEFLPGCSVDLQMLHVSWICHHILQTVICASFSAWSQNCSKQGLTLTFWSRCICLSLVLLFHSRGAASKHVSQSGTSFFFPPPLWL